MSARASRYRAMDEQEQTLAKEIGKQVQELRERRNWSQTMLGELAGLNQTTLSLIETGKQLPAMGSLIKLSNVFESNLIVQFKPKHEKKKEETYHDNENKDKENDETG